MTTLKRIAKSLVFIFVGILLTHGFNILYRNYEIVLPVSKTWFVGQSGLPGMVFLTIVLLSLAVLVGFFTNFYLYKWRRILRSQPDLLMPEEYIEKMQDFEVTMKFLAGRLEKDVPGIHQDIKESTEAIHQSFLAQNRMLDEKDKEIRRFKEGGDLKIVAKFLDKFVGLYCDLEEFLGGEENSNEDVLEELIATREQIWEALQDCDVQRYRPEIGGHYLETDGVSDRPEKVAAQSSEEHNLITDVLTEGYRVLLPAGKYNYIRKSDVAVKWYQEPAMDLDKKDPPPESGDYDE